LGINHRKQIIIYVIAILYDETSESFEWLFECFLNVHPKTILTDQCAAMAKAIAKVVPNTHHRLYIKMPTLICTIYHEVKEDFEKAWNDMLEYGLVENKWLKDLFGKKEKWALVYGRNTFCADMMSTQRSESINAVLKRYLNSQYNLLRFFEHYDQLLADRRYQEYYADFITSQIRVLTCASSRMLKQVSEVYTNEVYKMFEKEYRKFLDYDAYKIGQTDTVGVYDVGTCVTNRHHKVTFDSVGTEVSCNCKRYETTSELDCATTIPFIREGFKGEKEKESPKLREMSLLEFELLSWLVDVFSVINLDSTEIRRLTRGAHHFCRQVHERNLHGNKIHGI
jgi:zinc finger SWIM domain-containing protein 3